MKRKKKPVAEASYRDTVNAGSRNHSMYAAQVTVTVKDMTVKL
jgi:hypothetical protein